MNKLSLLGRNLQFCCDRYRFRLHDVFDRSFNISRIVRKYCERVYNESRLVAAQFFLDSIEIMDNSRHSVSLLSFNVFCEITAHLATKQLAYFSLYCAVYVVYSNVCCIFIVCIYSLYFFYCTLCTIYIIKNDLCMKSGLLK